MSETAQVAIQRVTDTLYAPFRYSGAGIPEGVQVSAPGWIYRDTNNGLLWFKKTGSAATGWKAMGGTLFSNTTQVATTGALNEILQENTISGGTLSEDGDAVEFEYAGSISTGGPSSIYLKLSGSNILIVQATPNVNGIAWRIFGSILRKNSTTIISNTAVLFGVDAGITNKVEQFVYAVTAASTANQTLGLYTVLTGANRFVKTFGRAKLVPTS